MKLTAEQIAEINNDRFAFLKGDIAVILQDCLHCPSQECQGRRVDRFNGLYPNEALLDIIDYVERGILENRLIHEMKIGIVARIKDCLHCPMPGTVCEDRQNIPQAGLYTDEQIQKLFLRLLIAEAEAASRLAPDMPDAQEPSADPPEMWGDFGFN